MLLNSKIYLLLLQEQSTSQNFNPGALVWNEAFSNYIIFGAGIVVGICGWLISRVVSKKSPKIIQVRKKEQVSLLTIDSQVERHMKLEYKGSIVKSLHRTVLDLHNRGDETIENFTLTINTDTENLRSKILEGIIVDSNGNEIQGSNILLSDKNIEITVNFLNPLKQYGDRLSIYIFSSVPIKTKGVRGRGAGWGASYFDQVEYEKELNKSLRKVVKGGPFYVIYGIIDLLIIAIRRLS